MGSAGTVMPAAKQAQRPTEAQDAIERLRAVAERERAAASKRSLADAQLTDQAGKRLRSRLGMAELVEDLLHQRVGGPRGCVALEQRLFEPARRGGGSLASQLFGQLVGWPTPQLGQSHAAV